MLKTAKSICFSFGITKQIAVKQTAVLIKKWINSKKKKIYVDEIKKLLEHEFLELRKPYFCSKCNIIHYSGNVYEKHKEFFSFGSKRKK